MSLVMPTALDHIGSNCFPAQPRLDGTNHVTFLSRFLALCPEAPTHMTQLTHMHSGMYIFLRQRLRLIVLKHVTEL